MTKILCNYYILVLLFLKKAF